MSGNIPMATDRLLKIDEVGALLGVRRTAIYRRAAEGEIPKPVRPGRWKLSDIQRYIEGMGA